MTFAKYQLTETLPYWIKRGLLFQKNAKLRPLYKESRHTRPEAEHVREDSTKGSE